jgi:ribose 1,5-bisphosphate isomerase
MSATAIIKARPSMISIANYILQLLSKVNAISQRKKHLSYIKNSAQLEVVEFIKHIQEATLKAAQNAAEIISDKDIIITCSYSSTVCTTFKIAMERALKFDVVIAESKYNSFYYGEISAEQMRQYQIPVIVIADTGIKQYVKKANKALVGADTICSDGSLVNGIPTFKLAKETAIAKIPLYSVCETAKFDFLYQRCKPLHLESGFDLTPPCLIAGIITEVGTIKPEEVSNFRR